MYDAPVEEWTLTAYWWNGRWGTMARIDVKYWQRGPRHAVLERRGGEGGRITKLYDGLGSAAAAHVLSARLANGDKWIDLKTILEESAAHSAAKARQRQERDHPGE